MLECEEDGFHDCPSGCREKGDNPSPLPRSLLVSVSFICHSALLVSENDHLYSNSHSRGICAVSPPQADWLKHLILFEPPWSCATVGGAHSLKGGASSAVYWHFGFLSWGCFPLWWIVFPIFGAAAKRDLTIQNGDFVSYSIKSTNKGCICNWLSLDVWAGTAGKLWVYVREETQKCNFLS